MPHMCTRCREVFDDGADILKGCPKCGGRMFEYIRERETLITEAMGVRRPPRRTAAIATSVRDRNEIKEEMRRQQVVPENPIQPIATQTSQIRLMKPTVRLINCARGGIINEAALAKAVAENRIAGAAVDVYTKEPPVGNPLLEQERIITTPHLGASTAEAQINVALAVADQIIAISRGQLPTTAINLISIPPETIALMEPYMDIAERMGRLLGQLGTSRFEQHEDRPNIIGPVCVVLGEANINIGSMHVGRISPGQPQLMVLNVDTPVGDETLKRILSVSGVLSARTISM